MHNSIMRIAIARCKTIGVGNVFRWIQDKVQSPHKNKITQKVNTEWIAHSMKCTPILIIIYYYILWRAFNQTRFIPLHKISFKQFYTLLVNSLVYCMRLGYKVWKCGNSFTCMLRSYENVKIWWFRLDFYFYSSSAQSKKKIQWHVEL